MFLFEVSAYTGFCDFSWDASIASLTDAAPDLAAYVLLKHPDDVVSPPIRVVIYAVNSLTTSTNLR